MTEKIMSIYVIVMIITNSQKAELENREYGNNVAM